MPIIKQLSLTIKNKPGELFYVSSLLSRAGVNISSIFAQDRARDAIVKLTVDDPVKAKQALRRAKIKFTEEQALALEVIDQPGALTGILEKLANAKINISTTYATVAQGAGRALVVLSVSDAKKAEKVIA